MLRLTRRLLALLLIVAPARAWAEEPQANQEQEAAVEDALDQGAKEQPGKTYLFVGLRYRNVNIPKFVQNWFTEGGETVFAHTPGAEFLIRKDGFEYGLFAMLGLYNLDQVPFKGDDDWETIDANYKIFYLGSDFMWSTDEFAPGLSLVYGAGAGLGIVAGSLYRTEAWPNGNSSNPNNYEPCIAPGNPNPIDCELGGPDAHYDYEEPSWADGGSSPIIFPWIAGNLGLRYKVNRQLAFRLDAGIMATGSFIGLAPDYGI